MSDRTAVCPMCGGLVGKTPNGFLYFHHRFTSEVSPSGVPEVVPCEGGEPLLGCLRNDERPGAGVDS